MQTKINNHASVVISYLGSELLSNCYDNTYPRVPWRNCVNFIGGGQSSGDISPRSLLERELFEEFSIPKKDSENPGFDPNFAVIGEGAGAPKVTRFASTIDIDLVRQTLLANSRPYADFLVTIPPYETKPQFNVIFSVYDCQLPQEVMDCAKRNLATGKSLVSEGFLKITSLNDILKGRIRTAWAVANMLEDYFGGDFPKNDGILCQKIGMPREKMEDYFKEFDYRVR